MNASELIIENEKLKLALDVAMETLRQISETPRNAGAKRNASATLKFIETQLASKSSY
ncbi:MAG: hypothetical protein WC679_00225 [Bacteroidales bacterium]|jgi:hypothetical protein